MMSCSPRSPQSKLSPLKTSVPVEITSVAGIGNYFCWQAILPVNDQIMPSILNMEEDKHN
jgi:hypothetical protein